MMDEAEVEVDKFLNIKGQHVVQSWPLWMQAGCTHNFDARVCMGSRETGCPLVSSVLGIVAACVKPIKSGDG